MYGVQSGRPEETSHGSADPTQTHVGTGRGDGVYTQDTPIQPITQGKLPPIYNPPEVKSSPSHTPFTTHPR